MKQRKSILSILLVLCLMCGFPTVAYAHEVPDMEKDGSISVTMKYDGNAIPGGTLTLYQVGDIYEDCLLYTSDAADE